MDVDFTQMHPDKKEQLMKAGKCFRCEKQGHLSRECPNRNKASIREATVEQPQQSKGKEKALPKEPTLLRIPTQRDYSPTREIVTTRIFR